MSELIVGTKLEQYHDIISNLHLEIFRLEEWFHKTFQNAYMRVETDADIDNTVFSVKLTIMTSKEATPENQGLMNISFRLDEEKLENGYADSVTVALYDECQKNISKAMNQHYQHEKDRTS